MIKDNIRKHRKRMGFSQEYISKKLGYKSFTTVQKWEDGTSEPPIGTLKKLARLLGVTLEELTKDDGETNFESNAASGKAGNKKTIPVLGRIATGETMIKAEHIERYDKVEDASLDYGLIVRDDSMIPTLKEDSIVYASRDVSIENGDIVVALTNDSGATIKRFYNYGKKIVLRADNLAHEEHHYKPDEVLLLGKVKKMMVEF